MIHFDFLPDEIIVEVFRFLDPNELLLNLSVSCVRFHKLVESDFMFQNHHFKYLMVDEPNEKKERESWKEYTKKSFLMRSKWEFFKNVKDRVECKRESFFKTLKVIKRKGLNRWKAWDRYEAIHSSLFVDPKGDHEWIIRITSINKSPCNLWLHFEDDTKKDILHRTLSGIHGEYLFQLDHRQFYYQGNYHESKLMLKNSPTKIPLAKLLDDENGIDLRIRIHDYKIEVEVIKKKFSNTCKIRGNNKLRFGILGITMNFVKELRMISYKKKK